MTGLPVTFADTFGVNIHASYTNTSYVDGARMLALLRALHVRHVRDGLYPWPAGHAMWTFHAGLKAAGISSLAVISPGEFTTAAAIVEACQLAGNIEALECTNEPDVSLGAGWIAEVKALLPMMADAAAQLGIPVLAPALVRFGSYGQLGSLAPAASIGNVHAYFGARNPETAAWGPNQHFTMAFWWSVGPDLVANGAPVWVTETGYIQPEAGQAVKPYQVPAGVEACFLMRTICDAARVGFARTYVYELLDQEAQGDGYGIVNADYSVKSAYTAIRHMLEVVGEASFATPEMMTFSYSGPPGLRSLWLSAKAGFFLLIWNGNTDWNPATATAIATVSQVCTLNVPPGYVATEWVQIGATGAEAVVKVTTPEASLSLALGDGMTIVLVAKA